MDCYYNIDVLFSDPIDLEKAHELLKSWMSGVISNRYVLDSRYTLPQVFEYEHGMYHNDYFFNDADPYDESASNSWLFASFYSHEMDEKTYLISISPSNHPGRDFILEKAENIAKFIKRSSEVSHVYYSVDSSLRTEDLAEIIRKEEPLKPEYKVRFIM